MANDNVYRGETEQHVHDNPPTPWTRQTKADGAEMFAGTIQPLQENIEYVAKQFDNYSPPQADWNKASWYAGGILNKPTLTEIGLIENSNFPYSHTLTSEDIANKGFTTCLPLSRNGPFSERSMFKHSITCTLTSTASATMPMEGIGELVVEVNLKDFFDDENRNGDMGLPNSAPNFAIRLYPSDGGYRYEGYAERTDYGKGPEYPFPTSADLKVRFFSDGFSANTNLEIDYSCCYVTECNESSSSNEENALTLNAAIPSPSGSPSASE